MIRSTRRTLGSGANGSTCNGTDFSLELFGGGDGGGGGGGYDFSNSGIDVIDARRRERIGRFGGLTV